MFNDYEPTTFTNVEGVTVFQPTFPDGTKLYYREPEGEEPIMMYAYDDSADKKGLTPATCNSRRKAIGVAKDVWKLRVAETLKEM